MDISDAMKLAESYDLMLVIVGLAILGATMLPVLLSDKPLSLPITLLVLGFVSFALPLGLESPNPVETGKITEHQSSMG